MLIKNLRTMGKSNKKLEELQDLNKLQKQNMQNLLGGDNQEPKKKHWLKSFCGGILRQ